MTTADHTFAPRSLLASGLASPALALSLAALFWSGNFIAGRLLRDDVTPVTLNFLRWTIGLVLLATLYGRAVAAAWPVLRREWRLVAATGLTGIAAFHTCVYVALRHTTAVNALLILAIAPVAILALSAVVHRTRLGPRAWAGAAVSLAGAAWLVVRGDIHALVEWQHAPGDLWMLGAVAIWAVYSVLLQRRPADLPPGVLLTGSAGAGLAWLAPLYAVEALRGTGGVAQTLPALAALAYVAIFASVAAFALWSRGVAQVGADRAGQYIHLMPLFGAALSLPILGEAVRPYHLAGAALVLGGIWLAQRRR